MAEQINNLTDGLNSDMSPIYQPKDSYRYAENIIKMSVTGDSFSISNEKGNEATIIVDYLHYANGSEIEPVNKELDFINAGYQIIGNTVLDTDRIVFLVSPSGRSQIGVIGRDNKYKRAVPVSAGELEGVQSLQFSIEHPIDVQARRLSNGHRIVYWTDNNRPFATADLDNPPAIDTADNIQYIQNQDLPDIEYVDIIENQGNLHCGSYYFTTEYVTDSLNSMGFNTIYGAIPVVERNRGETSTGGAYTGNYPDKFVSKSIHLRISNVDTSFKYLKVYSIDFPDTTGVPRVNLFRTFEISGNVLDVFYDGSAEETAIEGGIELVNTTISNFTHAKCVEQKDGTLFWSNLKEGGTEVDFQEVANNAIVKIFSSTLNEPSTSVNSRFELSSFPYFLTAPVDNILRLQFNRPFNASDISIMTTNPGYLFVLNDSVFVGGNADAGQSFSYDLMQIFAMPGALTIIGSTIAIDYDLVTGFNPGNNLAITTSITFNVINGLESFNDSVLLEDEQVTVPATAGNFPQRSSLDYNSEFNVVNKRGYRRGEVYSLGFVFVFNNGSRSFSYHIPAPDTGGITTAAVVASGTPPGIVYYTPGTYVSTLNYNSSITGLTGGIRHHVMPTFDVSPIAISTNGQVFDSSRPLGIDIEIDWTMVDPAIRLFIQNNVQKIIVVRQQRNTIENKSIISQGVVTNMCDHYTDPIADTGATPTIPVFGSKVLTKVPFTGVFKYSADSHTKTDVSIHFVQNNASNKINSYNQRNDYATAGAEDFYTYNRYLSFTTPDLTLGVPDSDLTNASRIRPLAVAINSHLHRLAFTESGVAIDSQPGNSVGSCFADLIPSVREDDINLKSFFAVHTFTEEKGYRFNYDGGAFFSTIANNASNTEINDVSVIPRTGNFVVTDGLSTLKINNEGGETYLSIITNAPIINADTILNVGAFNGYFPNTPPFPSTSDGNIRAYRFTVDARLDRELLLSSVIANLYTDNTTQYGLIENAEYISCKEFNVSINAITPTAITYSSIYGGDTFITKYSFTNCQRWLVNRYFRAWSGGFSWKTTTLNDDAGVGFLGGGSVSLKHMSFIYAETEKNTNYRHKPQATADFYPLDAVHAHLRVKYNVTEEPRAYNEQYSYENSINKFFPKPLGFATIGGSAGKFETRTIYSQKVVEGESTDSYRILPPQNFYDLPKDTGEIWDTFVHNNNLYFHTPRCLWKSFVNTVSQQTNDIGDVFLGTGGAFDLPSHKVSTEKGGYAGTISQWGGCNTPLGYIFPDALQGKVFLLNDTQLTEISQDGLVRFFNDWLSPIADIDSGITQNGLKYDDNPYKINGRGIISGFDYEQKRFLLTKHSGINGSYTISYYPLFKKWVSFHSYLPNCYITFENRLFTQDNSKPFDLWEHATQNSEYGVFYNNEPVKHVLELVLNDVYAADKLFDSLELQKEHWTIDNRQVFNRANGDTIRVYTNNQNSGANNLFYDSSFGYLHLVRDECRIQHLGNDYKLTLPLNSMKKDIDATSRHFYYHEGFTLFDNSVIDFATKFRDRIKGKYVIVRFEFSNAENLKSTINYIKANFRANKR